MKTTIEDVPSLLLRLHAGDRAAPALSFHRGRRLWAGSPTASSSTASSARRRRCIASA